MKAKRRRRTKPQADNDSAAPRGFGCAVTFIAILVVPLALVAIAAGVRQYQIGEASRNWTKTDATILASTVRVNQSSDGTTYHPSVKYRYEVAGSQFESDHITTDDYGSNDRKRAEEIIARYPVGARVSVFYNPQSHDEAVLERGASGGWMISFFVGLVMVLAIGFFWGVAALGKRFAALGLSLITVAAGITLVTVCIRSYGPHWSLAWNGERTEGTVSLAKKNDHPESVVTYRVGEKAYQIPAKTDTRRHFALDSSVKVVYRADDPAEAMIDSTEAIWVVPIMAITVGVCFTVFGAIMFLGSIAHWVIPLIDRALHHFERKAAEYDDLPPHLR
jgi:hypothetical protein